MRQRLVQYRAPSGAIHGRWYPSLAMSQAVVEIDGERCVRIDGPQVPSHRGRGLQVIQDEKAVVSHASPRWHGKNVGRGFYDNYTRDGKPVISSRAALREAQARASWHGESIERARELGDD